MPFFSEEFIKAVGFTTVAGLVGLWLIFRFGNVKIDLWKRRESKVYDNFDTTIEAINKVALTKEERLREVTTERDTYKASWEAASKMVEEKNATLVKHQDDTLRIVSEMNLVIEGKDATIRRLEREMEQANRYAGQVATLYEKRITRLKKWIRRRGRDVKGCRDPC